ncbi:hypothetical protein [Streptomyces canus]|uniref:hypothetical protein n=1 Tax=Streptomyces canus TaxID=58343 RepID=UPI003867CE26|nr:hypothetical protein OH824_37790 [Streptomyces canus]
MKSDFQRDLIPSDEVLQLIGAVNAMKDKLLNAAQQWELLDENGHVPATPSYAALLQRATDAQDLSRDVLRLTADFARSPHHTTRAGSTVLKHLGTAATMSSYAAPHFTETAECALALPRSANPTDRTTSRIAWSSTTPQPAPSCGAPRNPFVTRPRNSTTTSASNASSRRSPVRKARRRLRHLGRAVATADRACPEARSTHLPRNALNRPAHFRDADWAEYQQCQAEHDDLMAQVADRAAQLQDDLIAAQYELDSRPVPKPEADLARRTPPSHRPASRRRIRGR